MIARLCLSLLLLAFSFEAAGAPEAITLGIFAFRPKAVMATRYQPLGEYLSTQLGQPVRVLYLDQGEMEDALAHNQLDLVFTNPSHYLVLRSRNSLTGVLATAISLEDGKATQSLGGVIITRAERADLKALSDLKDKVIAIPGPKSFGGYQAQAYEWLQAGRRLPQEAKLVSLGDHDAVVEAVLAGRADAGFIRTGVLESLVEEGRLNPARLKVINRQHLVGFPYAVSTRLYPEWPFVALPHVEPELVRRLTVALFSLDADHPAARAAKLAGFAPPADYQAVETLARALRLPPYDALPEFSWYDLWQRYAPWLIGLGVLLLTLAVMVLRLMHLNHRLGQSRAALSEAEARYRQVVEHSPNIIFSVDANGRFQFVSPSWTTLLGHPLTEVIDRDARHFLAPEDRERYTQALAARMANPHLQGALEYRMRHRDGSLRWLSFSLAPHFDTRGHLLGVFGNASDITARKAAEGRLKIAASVFTHAGEGIMITDASGVILDVNDAFCRITGYTHEEALGNKPSMLKSGRQGPEFYAAMWQSLMQEGHWSGEIWNRRKNGEVYAEWLDISAVRDEAGQITHYVALFSDISVLKEQQRRLEHIAHYDTLTGLPNRVLLADRLRQGMAQVLRRGKKLAVAYIDLDGFKAINDRHGHEVGDQLLVAVAAHMRHALREVDTLARLGGDEFVAVLLDIEGDCTPLLTRLLAAAGGPVHVGGKSLQVSASIGVTFYPQPEAADADQLLRQADQAMYHAKLAGKNRVHVFNPEQDRSLRGRYESLERIRQALHAGEFELYYQPKVNMRQGVVLGAEALIRWRHPERGLLAPGEFLPWIEGNSLCAEIGEWVIDTALAQMEAWHAQGFDIQVSVNIGAYHIQQANFMERLRALLAVHPSIRPSCLELEVLETSALEDVAKISTIMHQCQELGMRFALDDFGTGYSSLTYLKRLPAWRLKIDQSFVRDMLDDIDDLAIVDSVISLAGILGRRVVAEGVETKGHGEILLMLGCEEAQGYGIAPPMPAAQFPSWAANWHPEPKWLDCPTIRREHVPVLMAEIEHRAWIRRIDQCLRGDGIAPPPLDVHQCRFGQWLDGETQAGRAEGPIYWALHEVHAEIHHLAATLLTQPDPGAALSRLPELIALSERLIEQLHRLLREG